MNEDTPLWCYVKKSFSTGELDMPVFFFQPRGIKSNYTSKINIISTA